MALLRVTTVAMHPACPPSPCPCTKKPGNDTKLMFPNTVPRENPKTALLRAVAIMAPVVALAPIAASAERPTLTLSMPMPVTLIVASHAPTRSRIKPN